MTDRNHAVSPDRGGSQPANDTPSYGSTHLRHPTQPPLRIPQTVTETTGPRFTPARFAANARSVGDQRQAGAGRAHHRPRPRGG